MMRNVRLASLLVLAVVASATLLAQQAPPVFQLALIDRSGATTMVGRLLPGAFAPRVSPDGRQVAFDTFDGALWIAELSNLSAPRKFPTPGRFPMWSLDGKRIVFAGPKGVELFSQAVDGSGTPELISSTARAPESWSPSGQLMSYITLKEGTDYDVWVYSLNDRTNRALVEQPKTSEMSSRFSPDGKWLAYQANDSGAFEIYVEPFPRTGTKTRVTADGGQRPVWSKDGREIFYDKDGTLYAVSIKTEPRIEVGATTVLPIKGFMQAAGRRLWDVTPDGRQFLVMLP